MPPIPVPARQTLGPVEKGKEDAGRFSGIPCIRGIRNMDRSTPVRSTSEHNTPDRIHNRSNPYIRSLHTLHTPVRIHRGNRSSRPAAALEKESIRITKKDFLIVALPLGCSSSRGVKCFSPLMFKRWGGGGYSLAGAGRLYRYNFSEASSPTPALPLDALQFKRDPLGRQNMSEYSKGSVSGIPPSCI